ncbi:helix-turn-helix domain-containing protein [Roseovarius sp. D0-M9]|uniref:helix-turn-helix domain-containing protein n=1 Tax=Roseovarius sp. D0-M9 TaxID=3127117 RepID=UPI0030102618
MTPENHMDFSGGYVAIPDEIMRTPMSDGAFRLLCILCSYADKRTGECFPRMSRLADDQGKSKAAISGYLRELRGLGLVETKERYKRRGNCILNYLITFWSSWRDRLRAHTRIEKTDPNKADQISVLTVQEDECPIHSDEHHNNQIQDNQNTTTVAPDQKSDQGSSDPIVSSVVDQILERWKGLVRGAPYPSFSSRPPVKLVEETRSIVQKMKSQALIDGGFDAEEQVSTIDLAELWKSVGVPVSEEEATEHAQLINTKSGQPKETLQRLAVSMSESWKRHWKKPSTAKQLSEMIDYIRVYTPPGPQVVVKYLSGVLERYDRSQAQLYTRI